MNVEIKTIPAFTAAGMMYKGKNENQEIKAMWGKINPRWDEIKHPAKPVNVPSASAAIWKRTAASPTWQGSR